MVLWFDPAELECDEAVAAATLADAAEYASAVLYELTGRRWPGEVEDTVTLIRPDWPCVCSAAQRRLAAENGCWCGCGSSAGFRLPGFPVLTVLEVVEDGVTLAEAEWRVEDRRRIVRVDGGWRFDGETTVRYVWGGDPPAAGVLAAQRFACELGRAWSGCKGCRLPLTATTVTRQGVTVTKAQLGTAAQLVASLPEVQTWVDAVLLGDRRRSGRVLAPEAWPASFRR